ncbi:MAG: DDE-type integrase/transposase/recombinase [Kiritimatiellae bacterium]|jgi:putative transposase|nr:DDE-type integrase/transposase/recombinase [Kiritimatiellia bacterium]
MKRVSVYLKLRVVGSVQTAPGHTIKARIQEVAKRTHHDEDGVPHVFTWRTIQTWVSLHKQGGVEPLRSRPRADKGRTRKVAPEAVREAIETVLPDFRDGRYTKMALYRRCIERGLISPQSCAQTTWFRIIRDYDLLTPADQTQNKRRLAFSKAHANDMWQMDTMFGPHMKNGKGHTQAKLIAFIDDASRVIPHGEFFFSENTANLITCLRSAFYKRGVPDTLYVDNGAIYTCAEINQICARVGTLLCHTPVRDGAAKGKIERFFRGVRDRFLIRELDLSSLEALNRQFRDWVENEYHDTVHGTLQMKPRDRFALDTRRIRFLDPMDANDELFFFEEDRAVRKDNTFQLGGIRYEAPRDLSARTIQVRHRRGQPGRVIVFYKGERIGQASPLDFFANDRPAGRGRRRG